MATDRARCRILAGDWSRATPNEGLHGWRQLVGFPSRFYTSPWSNPCTSRRAFLHHRCARGAMAVRWQSGFSIPENWGSERWCGTEGVRYAPSRRAGACPRSDMPHREAQAHVHFRTCPAARRRGMSTFGHAPPRGAGPCPLLDMPRRAAKTLVGFRSRLIPSHTPTTNCASTMGLRAHVCRECGRNSWFLRPGMIASSG